MRVFFNVVSLRRTRSCCDSADIRVVHKIDSCSKTAFLAWAAVIFDLCLMDCQDIYLYSESGVLDRDAHSNCSYKRPSVCLHNFKPIITENGIEGDEDSDSITPF